MQTNHSNVCQISTEADVVLVRQAVRNKVAELKFSLVDQTKVVTAASEIARNALTYGGGGVMKLETLEEGAKKGVRLVIEDSGPGIADIETAFRNGFTTGGGLGLGLGGAKRLMDEFQIETALGSGTRVVMAKWKFK